MSVEVSTVEKAAGAILYRHSFDGREYLLIRSSREQAQVAPDKFVAAFWDFPKGKIEYGETGEEGAKREVAEETGICDLEFMPDFLHHVHYTIYKEGKPIPKEVLMYLAEALTPRVELSREHSKFEWLGYDDAIRRVTISDMKRVLQAASEYLENI